MKNGYERLLNSIIRVCCDETICGRSHPCSQCEQDNCGVIQIRNMIYDLDAEDGQVIEAEGCHICTDKRGNTKEVFYDDGRGGLSIAKVCPNCGKRLEE